MKSIPLLSSYWGCLSTLNKFRRLCHLLTKSSIKKTDLCSKDSLQRSPSSLHMMKQYRAFEWQLTISRLGVVVVFENRQPVTAAKFINKFSLLILLPGVIRRLELKPISEQKAEISSSPRAYCQTACCRQCNSSFQDFPIHEKGSVAFSHKLS
jgi:hypothetical protein